MYERGREWLCAVSHLCETLDAWEMPHAVDIVLPRPPKTRIFTYTRSRNTPTCPTKSSKPPAAAAAADAAAPAFDVNRSVGRQPPPTMRRRGDCDDEEDGSCCCWLLLLVIVHWMGGT